MHQADTERTIAHLILIGGGTCSGKTTIARAIGKKIGDTGTVIISHDNYYLDLSHLSEEESKNINFDHPDAIDHEYLLSDVRKMLGGKSVRIPDYNFITHKRTEGTTFVDKADVIILEGIFALYYARLLGLADLKIFVDTDAIYGWHAESAGTSRSGVMKCKPFCRSTRTPLNRCMRRSLNPPRRMQISSCPVRGNLTGS
jgi:uridine kinase